MSSSDEDDFPLVKYGTPLEELEDPDIPKKPIAVHEQVVTDEQGRRRFHGAFTGGFSAGYYNSVDTKEGWKPSTFKSSRSDRTKNQKYVPEDFMDDEDKSEYGIAPKKIVPQSAFSAAKKDEESRKRKENFTTNATMLLGVDMLQSLIVPVSNNIGVKLLQKMGWKPGQGIGPKVKRPKKTDFIPEHVTFAPEDTVPMNFNAKENAFGLGYTGMDPKLALHDKVKKSSAISLRTKSGAKLSFAGQAFGVGAYEDEDQDIYAQDTMANYDLVMGGEENQDDAFGWSKPTKAITGPKVRESITYIKKVLDGFKKAEKPVKRKIYRPPLLPPDYDPHKRLKLHQQRQKFDSTTSNLNVEQNRNGLDKVDKFDRLDPNQRGVMLGEKRLQSEKPNDEKDSTSKSVFSLLSPKDRERLERAKSGENLPNEPNMTRKPSLYEPFSSNPAKQERYKEYLAFLKAKKGDPYSQIEHDTNMTEWEREQEKEEFTKTSRFFQPLSATMSSRFMSESKELKKQDEKEESQIKAAKMKMFGLITRECVEWHPDPLLCKRFNVPNPYPHSDIVGVPGSNSDRTLEMFLHPDDFKRTKDPSLSSPKAILPKDHNKTTGIVSDTKNPPTFEKIGKNSSRWDKEPAMQGPEPRLEQETSHAVEDSPIDEKQNINEESNAMLEKENQQTEERPSMELFKAIFENSDDSSSDDDSDLENETTKNNHEKPDNVEHPKPDQQENTLSKQLNQPEPMQTENVTSKIDPNVNRPSFHKFLSKSMRVNENKQSMNSAKDTTGEKSSDEVTNADDAFGPALPPVKIPRLWESTEPDQLKPKKSKKNKHKKHKKHKDKKKKKRK